MVVVAASLATAACSSGEPATSTGATSSSARTAGAAVAALLHPDWQEVGRSGRLWTLADQLDVIGPIDPVGFEVVSVDRLGADTILLLWRTFTDEHSTLRSTLWVRTGGQWRARFHQGTDEQ